MAGDLFAATEPLYFSQDQHEGQGRQSTHSKMDAERVLRLTIVGNLQVDPNVNAQN
jgi:hypothetical protein